MAEHNALLALIDEPSPADKIGEMPTPDPVRDLPGYLQMRALAKGRALSPEMNAKLAGPAHSDVLKGVLPGAQEVAGHILSSLPPEAQMALNFATRRGSSALPAMPPDRTLDALRYHLRQIGHDEGGWSSRLGKAAFAASPTAASAAFYPLIAADPRYAAWAAPALLGVSAATSAMSAATQLAPHYRMVMDKRDYLRAMDARQRAREAPPPE